MTDESKKMTDDNQEMKELEITSEVESKPTEEKVKPTEEKAAAKKAPATKKAATGTKKAATTKKTATKKTETKKTAPKKTETKKATPKKTASKTTATKKATPKTATVKKATAKKVTPVKEVDSEMSVNQDKDDFKTLFSKRISAEDVSSSLDETGERKSLDNIIKEKVEAPKEELDHKEVLRKKMEAQKKLNEELLKEKEIKEQELKNIRQSVLSEIETNNENPASKLMELEETIKSLSEELKNRDEIINKLDVELSDKNEKIIILTNSLINEKKEETDITIEVDDVFESDEVLNQGDIILRLRLLNKKIAEKAEQLKLVEDEINNLSEQDIFEKEFITQIKKVRTQRTEIVDQANLELKNLSEFILISEQKRKSKKETLDEKEKALAIFDEEVLKTSLTYTEKEEVSKKRVPLIAEIDALKIESENLEFDNKKLVNRYKDRLKKAEEVVHEFSTIENRLIELYLTKLREQKSNENLEYQYRKNEYKAYLKELERLNNLYEIIKNQEKPAKEFVIVDGELDELKKQLASLEGKLSKLYYKRIERENAEEVLRTKDPDITAYLDAFYDKEYMIIEANELNKELIRINEKLVNVSNLDKTEIAKLNSMKQKYLIMSTEFKDKIVYLDSIVKKYADDEKIVFYKALVESIAKLDEHEEVLKNKVLEIKNKIISKEDEI